MSAKTCWRNQGAIGDDGLTGKHGNLVNVMKLAKRFPFKTSPQISHKNLRSLVEPHSAAVKGCFVAEAGEILGQVVYECCGRLVGVVDAVDETAIVFFV